MPRDRYIGTAVRLSVMVAALLVAACGGAAPTPVPTVEPTPSAPASTVAATPAATYRITGTFTLLDDDAIDIGDNATCHGTGGYSDVEAGLGVVVRDGEGIVIATSELGRGGYVDVSTLSDCRFLFFVTNVPEAAFYSIEVGHRGELTYSFDEMVDADWSVALTLGG